jgi:hypothetical protein
MDQYGDPKWVGKMEVLNNDPIQIGFLPSSITEQWDLIYIDQDDKTIVLPFDEIDEFVETVTKAKVKIEKIREKIKRKGE